jgi:hypothetical protein
MATEARVKLQPQRDTTAPTYPSRIPGRRTIVTLLRKAAVATCASGAMLLGACYGATPFHDEVDTTSPPDTHFTVVQDFIAPDYQPPPLPPDVEPMPGEMAGPGFTCGSVEEYMVGAAPTVFYGYLCEDSVAMAGVDVSIEAPYFLTLGEGVDFVLVSVLSPDGEEVAQLGPEAPSIILEMTPGRWVLEATASNPDAVPRGDFTISVLLPER